jgi:GT2 family glycosyltransferase
MISFCIITDGRRPEKMHALLGSIRSLRIPNAETLIAYDTNCDGRLGCLRNHACAAARHEILAVLDDDTRLEADFINAIVNFPRPWQIMLPAILNPDGSRYWDWRQWNSPADQRMVNYCVEDTGQIIPCGAAVIVRRAVWQAVPWDETIGFYQEPYAEDIDWGIRLHQAGYRMTSNPECIVHHDDARYYQVGAGVMRHAQ